MSLGRVLVQKTKRTNERTVRRDENERDRRRRICQKVRWSKSHAGETEKTSGSDHDGTPAGLLWTQTGLGARRQETMAHHDRPPTGYQQLLPTEHRQLLNCSPTPLTYDKNSLFALFEVDGVNKALALGLPLTGRAFLITDTFVNSV